MKIRQGFVSNSSSSSFVIIGMKIDRHDVNEELEGVVKKMKGFDIIDDEESGYQDPDFVIVGKTIVEGDDYDIPESETSITEIKDMEQDLIDDLGLNGEIVIITGTKMS